MEIIRKSWPLGYTPCADNIGGSREGLQFARNITFDDGGVLTTPPGTVLESNGPLPAGISRIYTKQFNLNSLGGGGYSDNSKVRYLALTNGTVARNYGPTYKTLNAFEMAILTGGSGKATFGVSKGWVLICSDTQKVKDNGIIQKPLGFSAPAAPALVAKAPNQRSAGNLSAGTFANWDTAAVEGSGYSKASTYVQITADPTSLRGIVQAGRTTGGTTFTEDLTAMVGAVTKTHTDEDLFKWEVRISDTSKLIKVRLEILLESPTAASTTPDVQNYYWFEWEARNPNVVSSDISNPDLIPYEVTAEQAAALSTAIDSGMEFVGSFRQGINTWSTLQAKRNQFNRVGTDDSKGWNNVKGYRIIVLGIDSVELTATQLLFEGGIGSTFTGTYTVVQVNVYNAGSFFDKSPVSPASTEVTAFATGLTVTPQAASGDVNEIWIYLGGGNLDGYYRALRITSGTGASTPIDINKSETEIQLEGERADFYLQRVPDNVVAIVDDFYGRTLYFTSNNMYASYLDNPGGYDSRFVISIASMDGETILEAALVSIGTVLVTTTKDVYEITGTGAVLDLGDGVPLLDYVKRAIGVEYPPINDAIAVKSGGIIYQGADGWRWLRGADSALIDTANRLDKLYTENNILADGLANPLRKGSNNSIVGGCAVYRNRLYTHVELINEGRVWHIYDFTKQLWYFYSDPIAANNPFSLHIEEDGTILYGTEPSGDRQLRSLGTGDMLDQFRQYNFDLLTVFDDLDLPAQRKDTFTAKIEMDSAGSAVTVTFNAYNDGAVTSTLSYSISSFGRTISYLSLAPLGAPQRIRIRMQGQASKFKLYSITADVDPRPVPLNYLRIPPNNFGVQGKKRLPELPFVIDTRGNTVTADLYLDNALYSSTSFVSAGKETYNLRIPVDVTPTDIGLILRCASGNFEFYEMVTPREVEILPDSLLFKHIPYTNLGTASRKRFVQYAFVINTNAGTVTFTPFVDGVTYTPQNYITSRKQTVIYTFATEAVGIDIGGTLSGATPFEYYGLNLDECISEKLPPATQFLRIPNTNFGTAGKKRLRTIPFVIDTKGQNVTFTPIADGISYPPSVFNTTAKRTVFHYFQSDIFAVDFGGTLSAAADFEFYETLTPVNVETLPVGTMWDQMGPYDFTRRGKLFWLRIRALFTGSTFTYRIINNELELIYGATVSVEPGKDRPYEIQLPAYIQVQTCRVEIEAPQVFHRWWIELEGMGSGNDTAHKRIRLGTREGR